MRVVCTCKKKVDGMAHSKRYATLPDLVAKQLSLCYLSFVSAPCFDEKNGGKKRRLLHRLIIDFSEKSSEYLATRRKARCQII